MRIRGAELHAQKRAAFNAVFTAHWARVRHHIECVIDDEQDVDELVAEVFTLAWQKIDPVSPLELVWLFRTADNKVKDYERRSRVRARFISNAKMSDPAALSKDPLDRLAVQQALESVLSSRERRIVTMYYWDELAAGEIAAMLHCSQESVWTALSRARKKVERELNFDPDAPSSSARPASSMRPSRPRRGALLMRAIARTSNT